MSDRWIRLMERTLDLPGPRVTARGVAVMASASDRPETPGAGFDRSRALEFFNRFNGQSLSVRDTVARLNLPGEHIAQAFKAVHDWNERDLVTGDDDSGSAG